MEKIKAPLYAYIKGDRYDTYAVRRDEDKDTNEVKLEFETLEQLEKFVIEFSHYYSVPVQFYM